MIITLIEYIVLMFYFLAGTGVRPFLQWVMGIMAIRVVEFSNGVMKYLKNLPKNQRKFLNFENWTTEALR